MTTQTQTPEERLSKLEGAYEQANERLGDLTQNVASLRVEMREENAALRSEMNSRFNIMLVLTGGVWATMAGGFTALFTRL